MHIFILCHRQAISTNHPHNSPPQLLSGSPHVTVELEDLRELDPVLHGRLARMLLPLAEREAEGRVDDWALTYAVRVRRVSVGRLS